MLCTACPIRFDQKPTMSHDSADHTLARQSRLALIASAFVIAGVLGWLYEAGIGLVERGWFDPEHGGLGIPFLQIYGFGAVAIECLFGVGGIWDRLLKRPLHCFLAICVLTAVLEYAVGAVMLYGFGIQTWDYRVPGWDFLCTPDGLLCLRGVLSFAVMGLLLLYPVDTLMRRVHARWPRAFTLLAWGCVAFAMVMMVRAYAFAGAGAFK